MPERVDLPERLDSPAGDAAAELVEALAARRLTIAFAESLTGGLLVAELVRIPGASAVVRGGVVAYATPLKHTLLGVDQTLLDEHGAVHAEVAAQMARGIRSATAVDGIPADVGVATTGVAGPDSQDGHPVGTVFVAVAIGDRVRVERFSFGGSRAEIRASTVAAAVDLALGELPAQPE